MSTQAITFMTMQSNQYDGKNHKNDDLDKFESTQKDVFSCLLCFHKYQEIFYDTTFNKFFQLQKMHNMCHVALKLHQSAVNACCVI